MGMCVFVCTNTVLLLIVEWFVLVVAEDAYRTSRVTDAPAQSAQSTSPSRRPTGQLHCGNAVSGYQYCSNLLSFFTTLVGVARFMR